jgi:hypothetical protein
MKCRCADELHFERKLTPAPTNVLWINGPMARRTRTVEVLQNTWLFLTMKTRIALNTEDKYIRVTNDGFAGQPTDGSGKTRIGPLDICRQTLSLVWAPSGSDGAMRLTVPYPAELLRVARKVVWYDKPEQTLADLNTFLSHSMVYGSSADLGRS